MPSIRVDDAVMKALQKQAVDLDLVFGSPNDVLRQMLGLGNNNTLPRYEDRRSFTSSNQRVRRRRTATGSVLLRDHIADGTINPDVKVGYYHQQGRSYSKSFYESRQYPAALFDGDGFVIIKSAREIDENPDITVGANLNVRNNINTLPGYVRSKLTHSR